MNTRSEIENIILDKDKPSSLLLNQYMLGREHVTYDDVAFACRKEYFAKVLNKACFTKKWLIPVMIIPVIIFLSFKD